jgi:hypothetical protein
MRDIKKGTEISNQSLMHNLGMVVMLFQVANNTEAYYEQLFIVIVIVFFVFLGGGGHLCEGNFSITCIRPFY